MDTQIRSLLIRQARKGKPVSYGEIMKELGWDHDNPGDRKKLSTLLYEISKFEHENKRPLLSSMSMYSGLKEHGSGFYELSEQFGYGDKKVLKSKLFAFQQMKECSTFWQNDSHFYEFSINESSPQQAIEIFTSEEIEFLSLWGGQVYDKNNEQHRAAKNYIMNTVGIKTVFWSNELIKQLPGFDVINRRVWSQVGTYITPNGPVSMHKFKTYTWAKLFKKGDKDKNIFFTIGVDAKTKELIYKLDYNFSTDSSLNQIQKEMIELYLPAEIRRKTIAINKLVDFGWDKLLKLTSDFIIENIHFYENLLDMVWAGKSPIKVFSDTIRKRPKPKGLTSFPEVIPTFSGVDKDFIQESIDRKEIGDAGEELVLFYEKKCLTSLGLFSLSDKVVKAMDGNGYDILSFFPDGKPKYIEVKTTTGNENKTFMFSSNEYSFGKLNLESYQIYRLYNYNSETNSADFFIIDDPFEELLFQPINYKVAVKC